MLSRISEQHSASAVQPTKRVGDLEPRPACQFLAMLHRPQQQLVNKKKKLLSFQGQLLPTKRCSCTLSSVAKKAWRFGQDSATSLLRWTVLMEATSGGFRGLVAQRGSCCCEAMHGDRNCACASTVGLGVDHVPTLMLSFWLLTDCIFEPHQMTAFLIT